MLFCVSGPGEESFLEVTHNVTAVLGEDVYLSCSYMGEREIQSAGWKRQINPKVNSKAKFRRLAGFFNGKPFNRTDFSNPVSQTNLTVKMSVSSVEDEGEYICEFQSKDEDYSDSVFLTVVGKPRQ